MSKRLVLVVASLLVVMLVSACTPPMTQQEEPTPTPLPTPVVPDKPVYQVKKGEVINSVDFLCRVAPVKEADLFFKVSGRVSSVKVEKGSKVKAGDILAELEIKDLQNQTQAAQVDLEKAQLALEQAKSANDDALANAQRNLEIEQIKLQEAIKQQEFAVQQAQLELNTAELNLQQAQNQDSGLALREAQANLDKARIALNQAQIAYTEAQNNPDGSNAAAEAYQKAVIDYNLAQAQYEAAQKAANDRDYNLAQLQNAVAKAKLDLAQAQAGVDPLLQKNVEAAQREVDRLSRGVDPVYQKNVETAQLALERLTQQVDSARIIAPFDGEVLGVLVFEGRDVDAYKPVIVVAQPDQLELSCDLTSSVLEKLAEGMQANIVFSDAPGQALTGAVRQLPYPYGAGSNDSQAASGVEDKSTRISIADLKGMKLEIGQLAKTNVVLEKKDNALYLPPEAIRTFEGRRFVVVQDPDGKQHRVDVKVGIVSQDRVEITDGLQEGQVVVGP